MSRKIAVYSGSFDPVTLGHLDLIERASKIFDHLIVSVFINKSKHYLFPVEKRVEMIQTALKNKPNVTVDWFEGLLVDYMKKKQINVVIRGLRAISDLDYEFQIAATNRTLYPEIETVFLMPRQRYTYLSSSVVRDVASFRGDVSKLVTPNVAKELKKIFK